MNGCHPGVAALSHSIRATSLQPLNNSGVLTKFKINLFRADERARARNVFYRSVDHLRVCRTFFLKQTPDNTANIFGQTTLHSAHDWRCVNSSPPKKTNARVVWMHCSCLCRCARHILFSEETMLCLWSSVNAGSSIFLHVFFFFTVTSNTRRSSC